MKRELPPRFYLQTEQHFDQIVSDEQLRQYSTLHELIVNLIIPRQLCSSEWATKYYQSIYLEAALRVITELESSPGKGETLGQGKKITHEVIESEILARLPANFPHQYLMHEFWQQSAYEFARLYQISDEMILRQRVLSDVPAATLAEADPVLLNLDRQVQALSERWSKLTQLEDSTEVFEYFNLERTLTQQPVMPHNLLLKSDLGLGPRNDSDFVDEKNEGPFSWQLLPVKRTGYGSEHKTTRQHDLIELVLTNKEYSDEEKKQLVRYLAKVNNTLLLQNARGVGLEKYAHLFSPTELLDVQIDDFTPLSSEVYGQFLAGLSESDQQDPRRAAVLYMQGRFFRTEQSQDQAQPVSEVSPEHLRQLKLIFALLDSSTVLINQIIEHSQYFDYQDLKTAFGIIIFRGVNNSYRLLLKMPKDLRQDPEVIGWIESALLFEAKRYGYMSLLVELPSLVELLSTGQQQLPVKEYAFNLLTQLLSTNPGSMGGMYYLELHALLFKQLDPEQILKLVPLIIDLDNTEMNSTDLVDSFIKLGLPEQQLSSVLVALLKLFSKRLTYPHAFRSIISQLGAAKQHTLQRWFWCYGLAANGIGLLRDQVLRNALGMPDHDYDDDTPTIQLWEDYITFITAQPEQPQLPVGKVFTLEQVNQVRQTQVQQPELLTELLAEVAYFSTNDEPLVVQLQNYLVERAQLPPEFKRLFDVVKKRRSIEHWYFLLDSLQAKKTTLAAVPDFVVSALVKVVERQPQQVSELANLLRSLVELMPTAGEFEARLSEICGKLDSQIGAESVIDYMAKLLKIAITEQFQQTFALGAQTKQFSLYEGITSLQANWGSEWNILAQAAGRYQSLSKAYRHLLPDLGKAVLAEMAGKFADYRFTGKVVLENGTVLIDQSAQSDQQWQGISSEVKVKLQLRYDQLTIIGNETKSPENEQKERAEQVQRSVAHFLFQAEDQGHAEVIIKDLKWPTKLEEINFKDTFFATRSEVDLRVVTRELAEYLKLEYRERATEVMFQAVITLARKMMFSPELSEVEIDQLRAYAQVLRNEYGALLQRFDFKNDLDVLIESVRKPKKSTKQKLYFTTTLTGLRPLLNVGELVPNSGSCQSLVSGFIPETTLGLPLHGPSFVIGCFEVSPATTHLSGEKFALLVADVEAGVVTTEFDEAGQVLWMKSSDGKRILAKVDCKSAVARKIYRVGTQLITDPQQPEARLFEEVIYGNRQPEISAMFDQVAKRMNIEPYDPFYDICLAASLSQTGFYTDNAGGRRAEAFTLPAKQSKSTEVQVHPVLRAS